MFIMSNVQPAKGSNVIQSYIDADKRQSALDV